MFLAANETGKLFIAKRVWADGDVTVANKATSDRNEAYQFATADEANAAAKAMFRKSAGPAVEAVSTVEKRIEAVTFRSAMAGYRPSRHQTQEAAIHGDHELYT